MLPDEAKVQFIGDMGEPLLSDIAQVIGRNYPRASQDARDRFPESVAHDYYPIARRAMIESALPMLVHRHSGLQVIPTRNKKGSSWYYQLARNRSVLTQSKTDGPGELPRDADFRRTLAQNPQLVLESFRHLVPSIEVDANAVYGIVVHGPMDNDRDQLGFIEILIPDATGSRVLARIDLAGYWDGLSSPVTFPAQPITPVAPTLRIVAREEGEGTGA
jgi:hypothetical protein